MNPPQLPRCSYLISDIEECDKVSIGVFRYGMVTVWLCEKHKTSGTTLPKEFFED